MQDVERKSRTRRWSIGAQLLLAVNGTCAGLVFAFHVYDYHQELKLRLGDKRIALHEEAVTTQEAVREIHHHGRAALQEYIDRLCARMEEARSPGHHIAVRVGDDVLQGTSHDRASPAMLEAMVHAASAPGRRVGQFEGRDFIVGVARDEDISVLVSEFVDTVQLQATGDSLRRLGGSATLALLAAVIVNFVLLKIVVRPLEQLVTTVEQIGRGNFGRQVNGFHSRELSFLAGAINRMSASLAEDELRRRAQLMKASRIQQHLLPSATALSGATLAVYYEPAEDVAGDFYDVRTLADGTQLLFLADVTGHGIPAAMAATLLKAHLAEACERSTDLIEIVATVNRRLTEETLPEDFATAVFVRHEPQSRLVQIVNAGHDAALYWTLAGHLHECESSGLLLGIDSAAEWSVQELSVVEGDRLLMFTDGLTETFDAERGMFGRRRVITILEESAGVAPADVLGVLIDELAKFRGEYPQLDDITAILLEFDGSVQSYVRDEVG